MNHNIKNYTVERVSGKKYVTVKPITDFYNTYEAAAQEKTRLTKSGKKNWMTKVRGRFYQHLRIAAYNDQGKRVAVFE